MSIIDVMIHKVRRKIVPFGIRIETMLGSGYRLNEPARLDEILSGSIVVDSGAFEIKSVRLGANEKSVLAALIAGMGTDGRVTMNSRILSQKSGIEAALRPVMTSLEKKGLISVKSSPRRGSEGLWVAYVRAVK